MMASFMAPVWTTVRTRTHDRKRIHLMAWLEKLEVIGRRSGKVFLCCDALRRQT